MQGTSLVLLLLLALSAGIVLAGCHEPAADIPAESDETWSVRGSFTANVTQEEVRDLEASLASSYGATLQVMESHPMQYRIGGAVDEDCPAVRDMLEDLEYIAEVGNCLRVVQATEHEEPSGTTTGPDA